MDALFRHIRLLCVAIAACLMLASCANKYKQVKVSSFAVESVVPSGLRSFDVVVAVGINNPAPSFTVKDISATLKREGQVYGTVEAGTVVIDGKCDKVYRIPLQGQLAENVGLVQMLSLASGFNPEEFTVDVSARANVAGNIGKNIEYTDVPLTKLMKK